MGNLQVAIGINVLILWIDGLLSYYVVYQLALHGWRSHQFLYPLVGTMLLSAIYYILDRWIIRQLAKR